MPSTDPRFPNLRVFDHALIQHKLTLMREKDRSTSGFRRLLHEIALLMAYELTRDMPTHPVEIETPLEKTTGLQIDGKKTVFVVIMRAGAGLLDGQAVLAPAEAEVFHDPLWVTRLRDRFADYYFDACECDVCVRFCDVVG